MTTQLTQLTQMNKESINSFHGQITHVFSFNNFGGLTQICFHKYDKTVGNYYLVGTDIKIIVAILHVCSRFEKKTNIYKN